MKRYWVFGLSVSVLFVAAGCVPQSDTTVPGNLLPAAEAPDTAGKGETVALTARLAEDAATAAVTYQWFQTYGRVVELIDADMAQASFVVPSLPNDQTLRFRVDVRGPDGTIFSDSVDVLVTADPDYGLDQTVVDDSTGDDPFPQVRLVTSLGDIVFELDRESAPLTVNNVLRYVDAGFYDDTLFHRVKPEFVVQGGGYDPDLNKKETRSPIRNESDNGLLNERGTVAMARTNDLDSATSQFFINLIDNDSLDATPGTDDGYTVFARVISGMGVVDEIGNVETGDATNTDGEAMHDVPVEDVLLIRARRTSGVAVEEITDPVTDSGE